MSSSDRKAAFYARTMHTPDSPERAETRAALRNISKQLIALHRHLIDAAKDDFAFATGSMPPPAELLQLLTSDPFFDWLKPVTALIIEIDEMARVDFETDAARALVGRVEGLIGTTSGSFAEHYMPLLQREADITIAHAALRGALAKLPRS
jgi:hypothetical protein